MIITENRIILKKERQAQIIKANKFTPKAPGFEFEN
jgi:hypothetical protein